MVLSRTQGAEALDHILFNVFGMGPSSPFVLAIEQAEIKNIFDFMDLRWNVDEPFSYTDYEGNKFVPQSHCRLVKAFFDYLLHLIYRKQFINDAWTSITKEQFDEFRTSEEYLMANPDYSPMAHLEPITPFAEDELLPPLTAEEESFPAEDEWEEESLVEDK